MEENKNSNIADEYIKKLSEVDYNIKLPDTEYDVMKAVWDAEPPVTTAALMKMIGNDRGWKIPTLVSFLQRLEDRGFVMSYKSGKARYYIPLADRDIYLRYATDEFIKHYHDGSFVNLLSSYFSERDFTDDDIDDLLTWVRARFGDGNE